MRGERCKRGGLGGEGEKEKNQIKEMEVDRGGKGGEVAEEGEGRVAEEAIQIFL